MDTPEADIAVDAQLVARLIQAQHPDLTGPLRLVANGWDNALFRLGDTLCVRIPRRSVAAELALNEQRWLPEFARRVSVPIPVPVRIGLPSDLYPWPWSICPWFDGIPASDASASDRAALADDLAEFITQLHTPAPEGVAPFNRVRGVPLPTRSPAVLDRLKSGAIPHSAELRALWNTLSAAPAWTGPTLWLHGDLHPANLLLDNNLPHTAGTRQHSYAAQPTQPERGGRPLRAVLDFGDLTAGDPATDLAAAWLVFDEEGRAAFRAGLAERAGGSQFAFASLGDNTWARARGWALSMATAMAAHSDDNPRMAAVGVHAIEQVLLGG